jgi:hypothetical protein
MVGLAMVSAFLLATAGFASAQAKVPCVNEKKWEVKKDAKIRFRDVCRRGELQLDLFAAARESRVCSAADAAAAANLADVVQMRFEVGIVSMRDVVASRLLRHDFQWCAGEIDKDAYCDAATADAESLVSFLDDLYLNGAVAIELLLEAHRDAAAMRALCD